MANYDKIQLGNPPVKKEDVKKNSEENSLAPEIKCSISFCQIDKLFWL